jgi:hypothetical protein
MLDSYAGITNYEIRQLASGALSWECPLGRVCRRGVCTGANRLVQTDGSYWPSRDAGSVSAKGPVKGEQRKRRSKEVRNADSVGVVCREYDVACDV